MFDSLLKIQCSQKTINYLLTNTITHISTYHLLLNQFGRYIADLYLIPISNNTFLIHTYHLNVNNIINQIKKFDIHNKIIISHLNSYTTYGKQDLSSNYSYQDNRNTNMQYFNIYLPNNIKYKKQNNKPYIIPFDTPNKIPSYLYNYTEYLKDKYKYCILDGAIELTPFTSIPFNFNMHHAISYNKGCYLGQETTMKLYSQSKTKIDIINYLPNIKYKILSQYYNLYLISTTIRENKENI